MNKIDLKTFSETSGLSIEQLTEYIRLTRIDMKKFMCLHWLRGTCIFPKQICHHAHGFEDLDYQINSNCILLPPYPKTISDNLMSFKLDKKYNVLCESQKSDFVQKELKKYIKFSGLDFEDGKVYNLKELEDNRKIRGNLLTYTLLEDLIKFMKFIFQKLGDTNPIPLKLIVHELLRVGYCQVGSKTYKPGTILYHLQSYGACFTVHLKVENFKLENQIEIDAFYQSNDEISHYLNQHDQAKIVSDTNKHSGDKQKDDEEMDDDDILRGYMDKTQGDIDNQTFIVPIEGLQETTKQFTIILHETMVELISLHPKEISYETLMFAVDKKVDFHNQNHFPNIQYLVPYLESILMLNNITFDEYFSPIAMSHYPKIGENHDYSGMYRFQIERNFNQQQKECLEQYLGGPNFKFYLCRYWLRGLCPFKKLDCRFAHGVNDLYYSIVDNKLDHQQMEDLQQPLRVNGKPLIVVKTYRVLYFYQFELQKQNKIQRDQIKTVFEISQVKAYRDQIRKLIRQEQVVSFYSMISGSIPQKKSYIAQYYRYCGLYQTELSEFKVVKILQYFDTCFERDVEEEILIGDSLNSEETILIQTNDICDPKKYGRQGLKQEQKHKKQKHDQEEEVPKVQSKKKARATKKVTYLIPYRPIEQVQLYYTELIIQILIDEITMNLSQLKRMINNDQVEQKQSFAFLPLSEQIIKKQINQRDKLIDMPGFYNYLRMSGKRVSITEFLRSEIILALGIRLESHVLQQNDSQWNEILKIFKQNQQDFIILDDEMEGIESFIFETLKQLNQRQKYIINVDKLQIIVEQQFKSQQSQLQTNDKLKVFLRDNIVYGDRIKLYFTNYFLQTYNQGLFMIINPKQKIDRAFIQKEKKCKCGQIYLFPSDQSKLRVHNDEILDKLRSQIIEMGLIDPIVRDTLIVDNCIKLEIAQEIFNHVNFVGVDFEGALKKGEIWLAQLGIQIQGTKRIIIILDLMNAQFNQKDIVFHAQLLSFLSSVMQDVSIRKVFHDCRRDSQALHQNGICTKNATDTSVTYSLFQQITYFDQWKQLQESSVTIKKEKSKDKSLTVVLREIHQFSQPSLNDVLLNWNAQNKQNELKGEFHHHFQSSSHDFFFKRPHPEYMSYSARDVEDLTEVQSRMETSLQALLTDPVIIEKLTTKNLQYFL